MSTKLITVVFCALLLTGPSRLRGQDMDREISNLATNLANAIKDQEKKKVAVIDFTDLEGAPTELGKYVAEQLTVDLVMVRRNFSVLDRGNLRKILAEHKLTTTGLVDPDNAKKLGQFAGVDAIILGTVTPKKQNVAVTAKIIATDTAEIVGAAKEEFKVDDTVHELMSKAAIEPQSITAFADDKPKVIKSFGDLRVEFQSLRVVNGNEYLLTMTLTNQNKKKSIWVAIDTYPGGYGAKGQITDSSGSEFGIKNNGLSGIQPAQQFLSYGDGSGFGTFQELSNPHHRFTPALEIKANDASTATVKFRSANGTLPQAGPCSLQLDLMLGHDFVPGGGTVGSAILITKLEAQ